MPALITWWTRDLAMLAPDADPAVVAEAGAELLVRWTEPHRRYHGTRHLVEMFWALEEVTHAGELPEPLAALGRVGAWYHDAVYDPTAAAGANESDSAVLASEGLPRLGFQSPAVDSVVDLVRMTADHRVRSDDPLQRAFHDADLWILAADEPRFDEYCGQVREEYASVPDHVFGPARAAILRGLVGSSGLYLTAHSRRHWDGPARANLSRELDRLDSTPG